MSEPRFSLEGFRKWIKDQGPMPLESLNKSKNLIRLHVESKVSSKKLLTKIEVEEGVLKELVEDFSENGGEIADIDGKRFLIEVESGFFYIKRNYVKKG